MVLSLPWLFVLIGLSLIFAELFIGVYTGFDLVLIGLSIILGGLLGAIYPNLVFMIISTSVIILLYLIFGRQFIKRRLEIDTHQSNVDALVGAHGLVVKEIKPHNPGQVKINGEFWRAESRQALKIGDEIIVNSIAGVTLKVSKLPRKGA